MSDGVIANLKATVSLGIADVDKALRDVKRLDDALKALQARAADNAAVSSAMSKAGTAVGGAVGAVGGVAGMAGGAMLGNVLGSMVGKLGSARDNRIVEMVSQLDAASTKLHQIATSAGPLARNIAEVHKAATDLGGFFSTAARLSENKTVKKGDFSKFSEGMAALDKQLTEYASILAMVRRERPAVLNPARWPEGASMPQLKSLGDAGAANRSLMEARAEADRQRQMADAADARALAIKRATQAEINMAQAVRLAVEADAERERQHKLHMQMLREREEYTRRISDALRRSNSASPQPFKGVDTNTAVDAVAVKAQQALKATVDQTAAAYVKMQTAASTASAAAANAVDGVRRRLLDLARVRPFETDVRRKKALDDEAKAAEGLSNNLNRASERMMRLGESLLGIGQFSQAAFGPMANWLNRIGTLGMMLQQLGGAGGGGGAGGVGGGGLFGGFGGSAVVATIAVSGLGAALMRFHGEAMRVGKVLEPIENALGLVKGKGEKTGESFKMLTDLSLRYGLSMTELARPFMGLKASMEGTAMAGDNFKNFMRDFAAISGNLALAPAQIAGAAKAFEQMFSKGTVQAEEFRHQLGDRWPAAMRAGMEAYKKMTNSQETDTTKLMKTFMQAMKDREVVSTEFLKHFMTEYKAMLGLVGGKEDEVVRNINASLNRLTTAWDNMIRQLDKATGWTKIYGSALDVVSGALTSVGAGLSGTIGTIIRWTAVIGAAGAAMLGLRFAYVIGGALGLSTVLGGGLLVATGALLTRLGLLGAALGVVGAAMYALSNPASAALADIDKLDKRYAQFQENIAKAPLSVSGLSSNVLANDLTVKLSQLEEAKRAVEDKISGVKKLYEDELRRSAESLGQMPAYLAKKQAEIAKEAERSVQAYRDQLAELEAQETRIRTALENVSNAQSKVAEENAKVADTARQYAEGVKSVADLEKEAKQLESVLSTLANEGLAAAKSQQALNAEMSSAGAMAAAAAGKLDEYAAQMKKVIALRDQVGRAMADAEAAGRENGSGRGKGGIGKWKTTTDSHQRYEDIIQRADMIMEGRGREADATRKLEVEVRKYEEALRKVGETEDTVIERSAAYKQALVDRANGIDYSARKFDTLPMLNRHLDSTADKIAELMVTGELSTKKLTEVFANMAQSIVKDLIAMTLKMAVVMPIMQQMSSGLGSGGGNLGNIGSSLFNGGMFAQGAAFGGGQVVDTPTSFMTRKGPALMGEAGEEAVMPLQRGPGGQLGVAMFGGRASGNDSRTQSAPEVTLVVNITTPPNTSVRETGRSSAKGTGGGGTSTLDLLVEQVDGELARRVSEGRSPLGTAMSNTFGLSPAAGAR